jgi:hypothetical protein
MLCQQARSRRNTQTDDKNVRLNGTQRAAGERVAYAYFGCWLDITSP